MALTMTEGVNRFTVVPWGVVPTGATSANPIVITSAGHGLATGDVVSFSGIAQADWLALNGNAYTITVLTVDTFSIPVNGTGFAAYTDAVGKVYQDFVGEDYFPNGIRVTGFGFLGSVPNDLLVVRRNSASGQIVHKRIDIDGGGYLENWTEKPQRLIPYILMAECLFGGTVSDTLITVHFA